MEKYTKPDFLIEKGKVDSSEGELKVTPLTKSRGVTLGTSLRRVLMEGVPGCAIHAIRIEGASHEFDSIPGVREDAMQLILNLKNLAIKVNSEIAGELITLTLDTSEEGVIRASDIQCPAGVEIVNPHIEIANISKGGKLSFEAKALVKSGYRTSTDNKGLEKATGFIATDANYSPIEKVTYFVEPVKTGDNLGKEELILKVKTNGTISVGDAVSWASRILMDHLELFVNLNESIAETKTLREKTTPKKEETLDVSIEDLDLNVRPYNCLKKAGITTLTELVSKTKKEIKEIKNLGQTSYNEVIEKVKELGYELK